jgi:hypothetical protein
MLILSEAVAEAKAESKDLVFYAIEGLADLPNAGSLDSAGLRLRSARDERVHRKH